MEPPLVEVEGEKDYEIEAIVGHRLFTGYPQFMVLLLGVMRLRTCRYRRTSYPMPDNC